MKFFKFLWISAVSVICILWSGFAQSSGDVPTQMEWVWSQFIANTIVSVVSNSIWDIFAAGEVVSFDSVINGDVRWAGQTVTVNQPIQDDARLAGRTIQIFAPIQWELWAAWSVIDIQANIAYPSRIYWETININGVVPAWSVIEWNTITIRTALVWPLTINADSLLFLEEGAIKWKVTTSSSAIQETLTQAGGTVTLQASQDRWGEYNNQARQNHSDWLPRFSMLSILIFSYLILRFLPNYTLRAGNILRTKPRVSLWLWAAVIIGLPILSLVLLITVVGAPVAWVLLMAWIGILIFFKVIIVVVWNQLLWAQYPYFTTTKWHQALTLLLSAIIIAFLPWIIVFILWCFAVGASCQQDWEIIKEIA
jgi:hypothetical protein